MIALFLQDPELVTQSFFAEKLRPAGVPAVQLTGAAEVIVLLETVLFLPGFPVQPCQVAAQIFEIVGFGPGDFDLLEQQEIFFHGDDLRHRQNVGGA